MPAAIPHLIADVYQALQTEATWLHGRWICYRQLFGMSERRIELLNECASTFFFIIQDVLLDEIQVCLSKLTDPPSTGKFENLSLEQLQSRLEAHAEAALSIRCRAILDKLQVQVVPFRAWRNKRLAHLDLNAAMKSSLNPLPGVSRQMIEGALASLREFLNTIEQHYNDSTVGYEHFIMNSGGDSVLEVLRRGMRYEELLLAGTVPIDDWRNGAWHDA